jgi:SAM-dependent methyltransferase
VARGTRLAPATTARKELCRDAKDWGYETSVSMPDNTSPQFAVGACYRAALAWLSSRGGSVSALESSLASEREHPGALVPTLLECGARDRAEELLRALLDAQHPDGAWRLDGHAETPLEHTGLAVTALLAALPSMPALDSPLRRGCEWLLSTVLTRRQPGERGLPWPWSGRPRPRARLLAQTALLKAGLALADSRLSTAATMPWLALTRLERVTALWPHPWWHRGVHARLEWLSLLLDLGHEDMVAPLAMTMASRQRADGSVPVGLWSASGCPTCMARLAGAWCRLGQREAATRALHHLCSTQLSGDGIAAPVASRSGTVSPWPSESAVKAFLDAFHSYVRTAFDIQVERFEDETREGDGRVEFLRRELGPLGVCRVLDAGCGRGAIARYLLKASPSAHIAAVDLSEEMLHHLPPEVPGRQGSIQNLPFPTASFDAVYCVEALEHAGNPRGAVAELCRVVRPGGLVLIVDKNSERAGALEVEEWEQWFGRREVESWLESRCSDVRSELLEHCPEYGPELFIGWVGVRRQNT